MHSHLHNTKSKGLFYKSECFLDLILTLQLPRLFWQYVLSGLPIGRPGEIYLKIDYDITY